MNKFVISARMALIAGPTLGLAGVASAATETTMASTIANAAPSGSDAEVAAGQGGVTQVENVPPATVVAVGSWRVRRILGPQARSRSDALSARGRRRPAMKQV